MKTWFVDIDGTIVEHRSNKEISTGFGNSKKDAEKDASRIACDKLKLL